MTKYYWFRFTFQGREERFRLPAKDAAEAIAKAYAIRLTLLVGDSYVEYEMEEKDT